MRDLSIPVAVVIVATILTSGLLFYLAPRFVHAANLPVGTRAATEADLPAMRAAGISGAKVGDAWNPDDPNVGQSAGDAKQYLQSILRGGRCGPYQTTAQQLDAKFAICAARFLKDARAKDGNIRIVSMYRSAAHQAYLCGGGCGTVNGPCAPAGRSKHQQGTAIDISNGQHILPSWIQKMGEGYGVRFPVRNDSGHMEPTPGSNCSDSNFKPTDTADGPTPPPPPPPPSSPLSEAIRRALGQPPTPPQSPPPPPQQPQPTRTSQPVTISQSVPSVPQTIPTEYPPITPVSEIIDANTRTKTPSTGTSTFELIDGYSDPVSDSIVVEETVLVTLNPDTNDTVALSAKRPPPILSRETGTLVLYPSLNVPQTFTSSDLGQSPPSSSYVGQNTFTSQLLDTMKNALLYALNYLRPFGGYTPASNYSE